VVGVRRGRGNGRERERDLHGEMATFTWKEIFRERERLSRIYHSLHFNATRQDVLSVFFAVL
jgi:hypothetical protein